MARWTSCLIFVGRPPSQEQRAVVESNDTPGGDYTPMSEISRSCGSQSAADRWPNFSQQAARPFAQAVGRLPKPS
eukprot:11224539-Lingulodinium_polyedra.AAC.1